MTAYLAAIIPLVISQYWPWAIPVTLVALGVATIPWAQHRVVQRTDNEADFSVTRMTMLVSGSSENGVFWWIGYNSPKGLTIAPANLAIYLRVLNKRDYPLTLEECSAEAYDGTHWVQLPRLPTAGNTMYFGTNVSELTPQPPSTDFEANAATPIPARGTISGWALFEYPAGLTIPTPLQLRLSLVNDYGNRTTALSSDFADNQGAKALGGVGVLVGSHHPRPGFPRLEDFSKNPLEWYYRSRPNLTK